MNDADREAIQDLFARLRAAEADGPPRDPGAEAYIRDRLDQNPAAAYYLAQTVIAQEQALRAAQRRIEAAESGAPAGRGGGMLGGLFGGGRRDDAPPAGPWGPARADCGGGSMMQGGGGGFLAGAAQTAVGVAGGVMLGHMLTDLFDGDGHGGDHIADTGGGSGFADLGPDDSMSDDGGDADMFGGDDA